MPQEVALWNQQSSISQRIPKKSASMENTALEAAENASNRSVSPDFDSDVIGTAAETGESSTTRGYHNLAAFLDSDESLMMYRRFGYLQSRLLLEKQNALRVLEKKLDKLEQQAKPGWLASHNSIPKQHAASRNDLIEKIEKKFCEYCK
ncbi:MAG: hypothetical protein M1822_007323 [Bathelium mastoideum]|nr:MAG: hypothetical protein M1822_007323 [Bathelium mastoideum]